MSSHLNLSGGPQHRRFASQSEIILCKIGADPPPYLATSPRASLTLLLPVSSSEFPSFALHPISFTTPLSVLKPQLSDSCTHPPEPCILTIGLFALLFFRPPLLPRAGAAISYTCIQNPQSWVIGCLQSNLIQ